MNSPYFQNSCVPDWMVFQLDREFLCYLNDWNWFKQFAKKLSRIIGCKLYEYEFSTESPRRLINSHYNRIDMQGPPRFSCRAIVLAATPLAWCSLINICESGSEGGKSWSEKFDQLQSSETVFPQFDPVNTLHIEWQRFRSGVWVWEPGSSDSHGSKSGV